MKRWSFRVRIGVVLFVQLVTVLAYMFVTHQLFQQTANLNSQHLFKTAQVPTPQPSIIDTSSPLNLEKTTEFVESNETASKAQLPPTKEADDCIEDEAFDPFLPDPPEIREELVRAAMLNASRGLLKKKLDMTEMQSCLQDDLFARFKKSYSAMMNPVHPCRSNPSENPFCFHQFANCSENAVIFKFIESGLASGLNNMLNAAMYAYSLNLTCIPVANTWNYGNFDSIFDPISSCANFDLYDRRNIEVWYYEVVSIQEPLRKLNLSDWKSKRTVTQALLRIRPNIQEIVEPLVLSSFLSSGDCSEKKLSIGIHIRRGDKLNESKNVPTKLYLEAAKLILAKKKLSIDQVVVYAASDSTSALKKLKRQWNSTIATSPRLRLDILPMRIPDGHVQSAWDLQRGDFKHRRTIQFLAELETLARCDYVICTYSSNVCRFLQIIRTQKKNTILSLDQQEWGFY
jgi:hypothetical protein